MKKKLVLLLLTATMVMGVLSGCGNGKTSVSQTGDTSTDEKVEMAAADDVDGTTITFWHSMGGVNGQAIDTLVNKFNEENEYGITVEAQYQGEYDDSLNKLKSAQIGNMGADLVQVYEIGTRFMIESGWVVPMQEMVDADNYDVSQIEPNLELTIQLMISFFLCRSTHQHQSCTTIRICLRRLESQKFQIVWKAFQRLAIS